MEDPDIEETALFLWKAAKSLSTSCPAASRYYVSALRRNFDPNAFSRTFEKTHMYCQYCGSLWRHLNHKIRIQPIPPPNCHIKKLMKLEKEQPWRLNNRQKKKLKKYRESTNKIIYICKVCKKSSMFPGLKKYTAKEQSMPINTPTSKIKLKKGDLNAGLFISTPKETKIQNKSMEDIKNNEAATQPSPTAELVNFSNQKTGPQITDKTPFTSKITKKNMSTQITSSSKTKRKKGLLAQIINQEQAERQRKKTLSSFLTSV